MIGGQGVACSDPNAPHLVVRVGFNETASAGGNESGAHLRVLG